jgi:hypothetical protein
MDVDAQGKRHHGTLWWTDGVIVRVRTDTPGVTLVPVAARGERWGFLGGASLVGGTKRSEP